jgi:hypothetical protein
MKTLATFNDDGFPTAFYRADVNDLTVCPPDAVTITNEQWLEFINNPGRRKFVGGDVVECFPIVAAAV